MHVIEQRLALLLPRGQPFCGAQSIDLAFDLEQRIVPLDGLQCDRRDRLALAFAVAGIFLDIGQFKEFAPRVRMTKGEGDRYRFLFGDTERLEAIVTIALQNAAIPGQVLLRMLAAPVARRIVYGRRRCRSAVGPVIAHVGPYSPGRAFVFGLDGNGGVVAKKAFGREDMRLDQIKDRQERGRSIPDLVGQRRGRKLDALAFEPGALAVERAMHSKLVEEDRRQQMRTDEAARRGMERRRRLADRLAVSAGKFLPHRLDHFEPARNLLERLGNVLAQFRQARPAAACTADWGIDHHALTLDILRPRLSDRPFARERTYARGLGGSRLRRGFILRRRHHQFFELQFHLVDQARRALGSPAAQFALQLFDRQLQTGNQGLAVRQHGLRIGGLRHRNVPLGDNDVAFSP